MTIGCFSAPTDFGRIEKIAEAGFEYLETDLSALVAMDDADFNAFLGVLAEKSLPCGAATGLFPSGMKLVGAKADLGEIADYVECAFAKAARVGIKTVAFASSGARRVPDGFDKNVAMMQLDEAFRHCICHASEKYDINTAIENISRHETNVLNSPEEIAVFMDTLPSDKISMLCNNYHLAAEGIDYGILKKYAGRISHVHLAEPKHRRYPTVNDDHDYSEFFDALKSIGYSGGVTVEARAAEDEDIEECIYASSILLKTVL